VQEKPLRPEGSLVVQESLAPEEGPMLEELPVPAECPARVAGLRRSQLLDRRIWHGRPSRIRVPSHSPGCRTCKFFFPAPGLQKALLGLQMDHRDEASNLIIDRDYFTIAVDDLLKIRPLMTMVGGKIEVLQAPLASDFRLQPVGPVYGFDDEDVAHIGESTGN